MIISATSFGDIGVDEIELAENLRLYLLFFCVAILVIELLNMLGMLGGGEKLYLIDAIGIGGDAAFRTETGFDYQDVIMFVICANLACLWWISSEDVLDWEALLGDDDEEE